MEQPPLCHKPPREQGQGPSSFFMMPFNGKTTDLVNYGKSFRPIMYEFWHVDQQLQNFLKEIKTTYKKILLFELNIAPTN